MLISYILPFYHKADWFRMSLPMNLCFRTPAAEVICVLDDPADEEPVLQIVRDTPDVRFKVIVNDWEHPWRPPCIPINVGIRQALSPHVVIVSPESIISLPFPAYLESAIGKNWRDMIGGLLWNVSDIETKDTPDLLRMKIVREEVAQLPKPHGLGFLLCQRHALESIHGLNESLAEFGGEDSELRARLMRYGQRMTIDPCVRIFHPWHESGSNRDGHAPGGPSVVISGQKETWGTAFNRTVWDWSKR